MVDPVAQEIFNAIQMEFEKVHLKPYKCPAGKWTVGSGHVIRAHEQHLMQGITEQQAKDLLKADSAWAFGAVDHIVHVPITSNQRAALASLVFNAGPTLPTLLKLLNQGKYGAAAEQFLRWNKADLDHDGVVEAHETLEGLTRRRRCERLIFLGATVQSLVAMRWNPPDPKAT